MEELKDMVAMPKTTYDEIVERLRSIDKSGERMQDLLTICSTHLEAIETTLTAQTVNQVWHETIQILEAIGISHIIPLNVNTTVSADSSILNYSYEVPRGLVCVCPYYVINAEREWVIKYKLTLNSPTIRAPSRNYWRNFLVSEEVVSEPTIVRDFPRIPRTSVLFDYIQNLGDVDTKFNFFAFVHLMPEEAGVKFCEFVSEKISKYFPEEVLR